MSLAYLICYLLKTTHGLSFVYALLYLVLLNVHVRPTMLLVIDVFFVLLLLLEFLTVCLPCLLDYLHK